MRVIPVDDESLLRQHRCDGLERYPEIVVVGEADKVQSAAALVAMTRSEDLGFSIANAAIADMGLVKVRSFGPCPRRQPPA